MESFQTEEQQVDAIKAFWKDHGTSIVAGVVLGLAGYVGWGSYKDAVQAGHEQVSASYEELVKDGQIDLAGDEFIASNKDSAYASFAGFSLAKSAVESKDYAGAEKHLAEIAKSAPSDELKALALTRLARVQIQLEKYDDALASVAKVTSESFNAVVEEIKGDTYSLKGDVEKARTAYQAAIDADGMRTNPLLQVKLDDLAVASND